MFLRFAIASAFDSCNCLSSSKILVVIIKVGAHAGLYLVWLGFLCFAIDSAFTSSCASALAYIFAPDFASGNHLRSLLKDFEPDFFFSSALDGSLVLWLLILRSSSRSFRLTSHLLFD